MLIGFFFALKDAKVPVSIKEFLVLLDALKKISLRPRWMISIFWR